MNKLTDRLTMILAVDVKFFLFFAYSWLVFPALFFVVIDRFLPPSIWYGTGS
jgi:hypothetical protein